MKRSLRLATINLAAMLVLIFSSATGAIGDEALPGKGVEVRQARCTWDTGYFHAALLRRAMQELGYSFAPINMLQNSMFYASVAQGTVDFWANGWFPNQLTQMPKNFFETADMYGHVVKSGGLQGYLVDKKHQEQFNITSLADFKRAEVKEAFDRNGDGKADLFGSPQGWKVNEVMKHHLDVYDLHEHVNLVEASYNAIFADVLASYKDGQAVFFYTWAPNWTVYELRPGEDVVWINVPEIKPMEEFAEHADAMVASEVVGAVSDPIKLGFVINDIRIVANKQFAQNNPAAKRLFEVFKVPVADISAQNAKMKEGEDSMKDIERHVDEWIEANQATWQNWLAEARRAASE